MAPQSFLAARPSQRDEPYARPMALDFLPPGAAAAWRDDSETTTAIAELEQQLRHMSFFMQASLERVGQLGDRLDVFVTALLDLLLDDGVIDRENLSKTVESNRRQQAEATKAKAEGDGPFPTWPAVFVREDVPTDESTTEAAAVVVDCSARMHICHAVCCTLPFPLSAQEVEEGKVKWDLGHPYMIRHDDEGRCVHNDHATGGCSIYSDRPQVCRSYSCANDERIWKDFDNMVLNDEFLSGRKRGGFRFTPKSSNGVPVTIRTGSRE
jgi:Fe-S-cluster containining protein